ncbi:MAG: SDR family oxidoreductase [Bacteroidia bacterium]
MNQPMKLYLITGASRGIGAALARALLRQGHALRCVSRGPHLPLQTLVGQSGLPFVSLQADLSDPGAWPDVAAQLLDGVTPKGLSGICLIHNAAQLDPIAPVGSPLNDPQRIAQLFHLNVLAPLALTQAFVEQVQDWPIGKQVLNISSGAGRSPRQGWSSYCSSKAALDMYSQCLAAEQAARPYPVRVVSLAPGIVDTEMQAQIRAQDAANFPEVARFARLHAEGALWSPDRVAAGICTLLDDPAYGQTVLLDLRTLPAST